MVSRRSSTLTNVSGSLNSIPQSLIAEMPQLKVSAVVVLLDPKENIHDAYAHPYIVSEESN
jgi:hypothetical protein